MLALYIVAGIFLFIILLLSVPVDLAFNVRTYGDGKSVVRISWLFGLVGKDLLPAKKPAKKKPRKKPRETAKRDRRADLGFFLSLLSTRGLPRGVLLLLRRTMGSLHVRSLDAALRLGLDDPADTGMLYSVLWIPLAFGGKLGPARLSVVPAFEGQTFELSLEGSVRIFPAQMVGNMLRFVLSPASVRIIALMVRTRWRKRKSAPASASALVT